MATEAELLEEVGRVAGLRYRGKAKAAELLKAAQVALEAGASWHDVLAAARAGRRQTDRAYGRELQQLIDEGHGGHE